MPHDPGLYDVVTLSGRMVSLLSPAPEMFAIEDIAHALSHIPRFNGHTELPYTVAEHSIRCAREVAGRAPWREDRQGLERVMWALLHDAAEAYVGDMVLPLKRLLRSEGATFDLADARVSEAIAKRFGCFEVLERAGDLAVIAEVDHLLAGTELVSLFPHVAWPDEIRSRAGGAITTPMSALEARETFLAMFADLEETRKVF